jgi:hypothetical protein
MYSSGVTTSTHIIGSRSDGFAILQASLKHIEAANLKASSDESTSW